MPLPSFERIIGFTKDESKVYRALADEPFTVANVTKKTRLARMTCHYILIRFLKRGLVSRMKRQRHFLYTKISPEEVATHIATLSDSVGKSELPSTSRDARVSVHKGKQSIYALYEKVCKESVGERVYTIQPTASTKYIFDHYSVHELDRLHVLMGENELIIDDIIEEDFFQPIYEKHGAGFESAIQTLLDRMTATYALPEGSLASKSDMVIFGDVVLFIDWKEEIALEIRVAEIVALCLDLFKTFKSQTRHIGFRDLAEPYIKKTG